MVELNGGSASLDVPGIQPYSLTRSEDWCWGASAVTSLCLYSLGAAHLGSEVVMDLLDGSGSGEGIGISRCRYGGG